MRVYVALVFVLSVLCGCGPEDYSWNQRITVVVETPEGIVTGSSIVEVSARIYPDGQFLTNNIASFHFRGEAVAVEVAPDRWLFALLHPYPAVLLHATRPDLFGDTELRDYSAWMPDVPDETEPVAMPDSHWPRFVTFEDVNDPASVVEVDPNHLAASFGDGVRLIEVDLEVTREDAEYGQIERTLGWLNLVWPNRLDGQRFQSANSEFPLANSLSASSFSTEVGEL